MSEVDDRDKALDYYRTAATQGRTWAKPKWVPCRVLIPSGACGDGPFAATRVLAGTECECVCNRNGAVSVRATDGSLLGLRLDEFEVLEWRENTPAPGAAS